MAGRARLRARGSRRIRRARYDRHTLIHPGPPTGRTRRGHASRVRRARDEARALRRRRNRRAIGARRPHDRARPEHQVRPKRRHQSDRRRRRDA